MSSDELLGKKFTSHHSVEPIEYEVKRIEPDGSVFVQDQAGHARIMDSRIVRILVGGHR